MSTWFTWLLFALIGLLLIALLFSLKMPDDSKRIIQTLLVVLLVLLVVFYIVAKVILG